MKPYPKMTNKYNNQMEWWTGLWWSAKCFKNDRIGIYCWIGFNSDLIQKLGMSEQIQRFLILKIPIPILPYRIKCCFWVFQSLRQGSGLISCQNLRSFGSHPILDFTTQIYCYPQCSLHLSSTFNVPFKCDCFLVWRQPSSLKCEKYRQSFSS